MDLCDSSKVSLVDVVNILVTDRTLLQNWYEFCGYLNCKPEDEVRWSKGIKNDTLSYFELFSAMLTGWINRNGKKSINDLTVHLIKIGCRQLSETLSEKFRNSVINVKTATQRPNCDTKSPKRCYYGAGSYLDILNDGSDSERVTKPADKQLNENKQKEAAEDVKTDEGFAVEKDIITASLLQMHDGTDTLARELVVELPEINIQDAVLAPESSFSDEAAKIYKSIPPLAWVGILMLLCLLACLDLFRYILFVGVICGLTFYAFNSWLSKAKMETVAQRNERRDNTIELLEITNMTRSFDENVLKGHDMTLEAIKSIESMRADMANYRIKAADMIHNRETDKDLQIQKMTELGLLTTAKLNAATACEIKTIEGNTKTQVENIKAETDRAREHGKQLMEDNRLKNEFTIKRVETKTQDEIKWMDINFQTLDANLRADVDKTRVNAERDTQLAKEQHQTERFGLEHHCELEKAKSSHLVDIVRCQEQTKQAQAQNHPRRRKGFGIVQLLNY